jgi:rod shape-determining protein MreC
MFSIHRRTVHLLLIISLGHVLLISAQVQSKSGLPLLQQVAFSAFARVQRATAAVADTVSGTWTHYVALRGVAAENDALKRQVLELQGKLQQQQAIADRTQALEEALHLEQTVAAPLLAARVIAGNPAPGDRTVMIDRGSADGVKTDMAVISATGVVGRVINRPTPHAAQVQLLIDRTAAAAVIVERSGVGAVVEGGITEPPLHLAYVDRNADIRSGDRIMTSGQDGIFPQGFVVGTIGQVDRNALGFRLIAVQPAVNFSHVDLVLVVMGRPLVTQGAAAHRDGGGAP